MFLKCILFERYHILGFGSCERYWPLSYALEANDSRKGGSGLKHQKSQRWLSVDLKLLIQIFRKNIIKVLCIGTFIKKCCAVPQKEYLDWEIMLKWNNFLLRYSTLLRRLYWKIWNFVSYVVFRVSYVLISSWSRIHQSFTRDNRGTYVFHISITTEFQIELIAVTFFQAVDCVTHY